MMVIDVPKRIDLSDLETVLGKAKAQHFMERYALLKAGLNGKPLKPDALALAALMLEQPTTDGLPSSRFYTFGMVTRRYFGVSASARGHFLKWVHATLDAQSSPNGHVRRRRKSKR